MADSAIEITAGTGTNIDTRTEATNGNHRQVIVIGDPATNAGVAPVDVTNGLAVQIIPALPAGTNAIGKLAANDGVDIGNVDVASSALPTGASTAAKQPALGTAGASSVDVISVQGIASMTPIQVADNGGAITVDGTVAVTNADMTTVAGAVAGTEMQVDVVTMPTTTVQATNLDIRDLTSASDSVAAVCTNAGTFAVQAAQSVAANLNCTEASAASIKTAVEIMDDWDSGDTCKISVPAHATRVQGKVDNADTTTAREVLAAIASNYVYITSFVISVAAAGNYWLEDSDATQITPKFYLAANGGVSWSTVNITPYKTTTVNKAINVKGSTAGAVGVMLTGYSSTV